MVPGKVKAKDVVKLSSARTVRGGTIKIINSNGVYADNAKVVPTAIESSNRVIHVIDAVLLPNETLLGLSGRCNRCSPLPRQNCFLAAEWALRRLAAR